MEDFPEAEPGVSTLELFDEDLSPLPADPKGRAIAASAISTSFSTIL